MKIIKGSLHAIRLMVGLLVFLFTRKTPGYAYQSMISLFCLTKGRSNDLLSQVIGWLRPFYDFGATANGILGKMESSGKDKVVADLRTKGYHVFEKKIPLEICDRLIEFALSHPCVMYPMDGKGSEKAQQAVYPRGRPEAIRYDFTTQDLLANRDVQMLLADMSFPAVAQEFLGARPVIDVLGMWWSTAYSDMPDMEAAQYYHFDMDRPKWLKFFIYLTDVTTENGPHTFIEESQQSGGIPDSILRKGYVRLTDEEVEQHYGREKVVEIVAPRGTILAEDTRGLHKGRHISKGDRLMLQIQFSNSLFGGSHLKSHLPSVLTGKFADVVSRYPHLYSSFL
jgi:hypothetical protein